MNFVKRLIFWAFRMVLTVWYALVRLFVKKGDAVAFLSRESDSVTLEFQLIAEELALRRPQTQQIFCCKRAA